MTSPIMLLGVAGLIASLILKASGDPIVLGSVGFADGVAIVSAGVVGWAIGRRR